jgi:Tfp pilus assembly protein PilO
MKNIFKNHIFSLIILLILAVLVIAGFLFFIFSIKTKTDRIIEVKQRIALYQKNKKSFTNQVDNLKLLEKRLIDLESKIITNENIPKLLSHLEALAQDNGTSFEITTVQTPIENEKNTLFIEFNTRGSYDQIQNFLNQLQHQSFQISITKLFLFSEQAEVAQPAMTGTLSVIKPKTSLVVKEKIWQGVVIIKVLSF